MRTKPLRVENDSSEARSGGAGRNRTDDPLLAKQVLSQLSYSPILDGKSLSLMPRAKCARGSGLRWWAWIELNYRPRAYQARALTN
jgi:hypothetical protein